MLLSDRDIHIALKEGRIGLDPFDPDLVQPASVDVRLSALRTLVPAEVDLRGGWQVDTADASLEDGYRLYPGQFVLGSTVEHLTVGDDIAAAVEGKSSLGRLGLMVHVTAGWIDPGFSGQITLEIRNVGPMVLVLHPQILIGQLVFQPMSSPVDRPYGSASLRSKYQHQRGPTAARGAA